MSESTEEWRPVKGYEGAYEVSDQGRVRSMPRAVRNPLHGAITLRHRDMKQQRTAGGYMCVTLCRDGIQRTLRVHRVVADAFIGLLGDATVDHIDGDRAHNAVRNLRVCAFADNVKNQGVRTTNTSGYTGVSFDAKSAKWRAYVNVGGKPINVGFFSVKDDAIAARRCAAIAAYGEFMRQPDPPPPAPDKRLIGDALKTGAEVPGAHIETRSNLQIK